MNHSRSDADPPTASFGMLHDGTYDAIVVDADGDDDVTRLELTILTGAHKGEVVTIVARGLGSDALELLGLPATIVVDNGEPRLTIDRA